jgi:hypothetical protein
MMWPAPSGKRNLQQPFSSATHDFHSNNVRFDLYLKVAPGVVIG